MGYVQEYTAVNYINFHYRPNSEKMNDEIFQWIKKKPILKNPPKKGSTIQNFMWVSNAKPKFGKTNDPISR